VLDRVLPDGLRRQWDIVEPEDTYAKGVRRGAATERGGHVILWDGPNRSAFIPLARGRDPRVRGARPRRTASRAATAARRRR